MASKVGIVESINDGKFFAKDSLGNTKELKNGDIIYENDVVFSDGSNSSNSEIRVALEGEDIIVLKNGVQQLFDSSLIASTFGDEEMVFAKESIDAMLDSHSDITNVWSNLNEEGFSDYQDITEEETAAGEEEEEILEEGSIGQFANRDGDITDIVSDLRKKSWARSQDYREVENSEKIEKISLKSLGGLDSTTNTPPPTVTPPPLTPPTVTPPPPVANLSIDDITMYEQDGFMVFTVTLDRPANGNITVNFATSNGSAEAGKDYTPITGIITIPSGSSTAQIRVPINDDYYYEKSETFNVTLTNPTGNVNIVKPVGVGTILDNPPSNNKPLDPNKPDSETGTYGEEDSVYAIITGSITVNEGDKANYTVQIIDKNGNPVVVTKDTKVTVVYKNISTSNDDTEYKDSEYIKKDIIIKAGTSKSEIFDVETKDDYLADNGEKYNLAITKVNTNEFENVVIGDINGNNKDVTTEILDNSKDTPTDPYDQKDIPPVETDLDTITIKLFAIDPVTGARVPANEVLEGNDAEYIAVAFDKNNNEVLQGETVTVTFGKSGDTATNGGVDYVSTTQIVTIGTKFSTATTDDYIADNGEFYSVQILDETLSNASNYETVIIDTTSVTTTILDDSQPNTPNNPNDGIEQDMESVTVKLVSTDALGNIIPEATIPEGEIAYYKAILVDPDGNEIIGATGTVDITFTDGTAIRTGTSDEGKNDFTATNQTVTLNTVFSAVANDDYIADNGETFNVQITDDTYSKASDYENVIHDTTPVITTITDNSKPVDGNTPHDPNDTPNHTTENNKEIVTIKLFAADSNGNVIKDGTTGNYVLANTADEDTYANYIAYAFNYGESEYNDSTKLTTQVGKVDVSFTDGTAKGVITTQTTTDGSQDFDNKAQTITIGESFSTKVFNDVLKEGTENYTVSIDSGSYAVDTVNGGYESVTIDTTAVTTTINDSTIPMKVFVKIEPVTDTVNESGDLEYKVTLVDVDGNEVNVPTGKSITVDLTYTNVTTSNNDYTTPTTQVTITGGSSTNFTVPTVDDYFAEGDESLKIVISNITGDTTVFEEVLLHTTANGATSDKVEVIGTIQDNPANKVKVPGTETPPTTGTPNEPTDPDVPVGTGNPPIYGTEDTVYVKITKTPSTIEGGDLVHTVTLVDANGDDVKVPEGESVTVTLAYTDSTTESGEFTESDLSTIVKTVTITGAVGGTSSVDFTNITKDDFTAEGDEVYTVTITDVSQSGAFENVVIADATAPDAVKDLDSTTGTIKDGVILGTPVDVKVDEDDFVITDTTPQISKSENLGITTPNTDEDYTLSFDNTIKVFKGDATSSETNIYGDSTGLKSGGVEITYEVNGDTITGKAGTETVFTITLNKNAAGGSNDNYTYTQYKNIDHPVAGPATDNVNDDDITFEFGFNINDQGQKSSTQTFKVTVNDSMPVSGIKEVAVVEDSLSTTPANKFIISQENFKDGKIEISNDAGTTYTELATNGTIDIKDPNDSAKTVGTLTNNGDGTVTFVPIEDYSNYNAKPTFSYKVSDNDGDYAEGIVNITVKPVADAPKIEVTDVVSYEDASTYSDSTTGNAAEGGNKIPLGLETPTLSKDQTDKNGVTGDQPEKNGEITLTFTNGDKVTGAKIFKADGTTQVGTDITTANQTLKVVIVTSSGDSSTIDYTYHHADITASNPSGAIYLTKTEYEALVIQHAEDNDTDIKIKIGVTSYELDDSNKPLNASGSTYTDRTNADLSKTTEETMTVKIHPATDDISLNWNEENGKGTFDAGTKIFTFTTEAEGEYFDTPIDLKGILTKTSGTETDSTPKGGDLDGSEKRTYTVSGIPEGTVITLGGQTATAGSDGIATINFNNTNNKLADPDFSMKLPEHYSGTVNGTIKLSVQDKGVDSDDIAGTIKTEEVYFNVVINPVADQATIQVSQAVGFEDAGRDGGNTVAKDGTINANGTGGIPLDIKVSSDDKDGSEKFDVTISGIPAGAVIYYDGAEKAGASITIVDFDNTKSLVIIPPHNSDADFTLNVSAKTKDGGSVASPTVTTIDVIVKNVADAPVGTELKTTTIEATEDTPFNLKDIYTTPANLASYDDSEVLTVKIDFKDTGITIATGTPFYIEDGMYVVKASDITADKIMLNIPKDFSGNTTFDLTYVTTEKAGEGDSKTWNTNLVSIFVNPIADDVTVAESSTLNEDEATKVDLTATLKDTGTTYGTENIDNVYILKSSIDTMITQGYTLTVDGSNITSKSTESLTGIVNGADGVYYVLTHDEADRLSVINTVDHKVNGNFSLNVAYKVTDTKDSASDTKIYGHTHTVNVQAVTDDPTLSTKNITQVSGNVAISDTTVTVNEENSSFKVPVTTTSNDKDGSETVTKIVISGVPMGVEVVGGTYYGYSGSQHNGIWVVAPSGDASTKLDADGALSDITFKVNTGADFAARDIKITTYTQDGAGAEVKNASQTIHIDKSYSASETGPGTPAELELAVKSHAIQEDTEFTLADVLGVNLKSGGSEGNGGAVITFTDIPAGSKVTGADYSYEKTEAGVTKTYYVVVGNGNAADMNTQLADVKITTPKDVNTDQVAPLQGSFIFTADIATHDSGGFKDGNQVTSTQNIAPVTDAMTVAVSADNINEDGRSNLSITLSNPSDGTKTELIGNSLTITVTETWADTLSTGTDGIKGTLVDSSGKYNVVDNGDRTYTITPILPANNFTVGTAITGLQYTPALNRDGSVKFEVTVKNQETGSTVELDSTGDTSITVSPEIDIVLNTDTVIASGTEDTFIDGIDLANPVKFEIKTDAITDGSESLGNIILDEVPNGFTVWYKDASDNLVMATNIGTTTGTDFDLTPNISGDDNAARNKWLVPNDGTMPEIYINAPVNWSGDFDFKATVNVKEENLSSYVSETVSVTGHIDAVADDMTIAPTLTFGDAFSWVDLKLNANMKDVDGSETMSLKITGLNESAQFQLANGTLFDGLLGNPKATYVGSEWQLEGITYDQINNIQFAHDKSVERVGVIANTVEIGNAVEGTSTDEKGFELKLSDVSGNFKLDSGLSLDFSKIDSINTLKNIDTINLSADGENKLDNLTLQDVLDMTDSSNILKITGTSDDEVSFKGTGWSKTTETIDSKTFNVYSNSGNADVKVKVEHAITDGITN